MLWVAEGRRSQVLPVVLAAVAGALLLVFACYGFSPDAFSYVFRSCRRDDFWISIDPARRFFSMLAQCWDHGGCWRCRGRSIWACAGRATSAIRLRCFAFWCLVLLVMTGAPGSPWLWSLPFLLTFVGGVFADAYEGPRGRLAMAAAGAMVLLQAVFCVMSLPGLL